MKNRHHLAAVDLSDTAELHSLVEHRKVFSLNHFELNMLETYQPCTGMVLSYNGLVITSMLRGKKVMHLFDRPGFDFLPGETIVLPDHTDMKVDFPEADKKHPVQCATLAIDWDIVNRTLDYLNENYPGDSAEWALNFNRYHFYNNRELAHLLNKLISISMEDGVAKDVLADLTLKELLIRTIQTQNLQQIEDHLPGLSENGRLSSVMEYIRLHLTEKININMLCREACMSKSSFFRAFKETFGRSPVELIVRERIELAKRFLADPGSSISEVCYRVGFNNLQYFTRMFKRLEGITPKHFQRINNE